LSLGERTLRFNWLIRSHAEMQKDFRPGGVDPGRSLDWERAIWAGCGGSGGEGNRASGQVVWRGPHKSLNG
jgi:hypothetical protein